jgi:hypothetical protein
VVLVRSCHSRPSSAQAPRHVDAPVLVALLSAILALGSRRVGEPSLRASRPSAWVALSDQGDLAVALEILAPGLLQHPDSSELAELRGGHLAAWEQPQLFSEEMRATFRSLR